MANNAHYSSIPTNNAGYSNPFPGDPTSTASGSGFTGTGTQSSDNGWRGFATSGEHRHELSDFYDNEAIPAPHRLSSYSTGHPSPSQSYSDLRGSTYSGPNALEMDHRDSYYSDHGKEGGLAGAGSGFAGAGAAGGGGYSDNVDYDPQGRAGQRWQERHGQGHGEGAAGGAGAGYLAGSAAKKSNKKLWWIAGGILAVIVIAVGVALGVTLGKKNGNGGSGSGSGSNSSNNNNAANGGNSSNSGDPSNFTKDSRLHNSFYAFAYTPQEVQYGQCNPSLANITQDIQLLSQLTTRIRLYGANCNQTAMVLQAIQDTKVDMSVFVAIYVDSNDDAFTSQVQAVEDALKTYGTDHVLGVTVGNEYLLNNPTAAGLTKILADIKSVNQTIQGLGLSKTLPVGTSDAGSMFSLQLAEGIDYFHANVHPWFGAVPIDQAADWTWQYFTTNNVDVAAQAPNKPTCAIAETGWPTGSDNVTEENNGATGAQGDASLANLQTFLDTYVCAANANGTEYFYFEAFDEPWKRIYGGVEPHWGLFDSNRNLKDVTIPNCSHN